MKNGKVSAQDFADCLFGKDKSSLFEIPKGAELAVGFDFPNYGEYLFGFSSDGEVGISFRRKGTGFEQIARIENCSGASDIFYKMGIVCVFYAESQFHVAFTSEELARIWFE